MFEKQVDYSTYATEPGEARGPINQFAHYRKFVDASNRSIVGFNVDNLYSIAWIDLSAEPLVLSVPAMGDRYSIMQIVDAWNGVPATPGSRTLSGAEPHLFLIAGRDSHGAAPEGMQLLRSPTNLAGIGGNLLEDASYPLTLRDADAEQLTGERHYTLTFARGGLAVQAGAASLRAARERPGRHLGAAGGRPCGLTAPESKRWNRKESSGLT